MKINLSKEDIKKGCELIPTSGYVLKDGALRYKIYYIENHQPLYRDFLQLVVKAINKKYRSVKAYVYGIDQTRDSISIGYDSKTAYEILETFYYSDMSEEEAKEKAISYVFENMED